MKIDTSDVKRWTILNMDWKLYRVVDTSHTHTWRWSATYWFKVKNIIDWSTNTFSFKSWTTLESAEVNTKNAVYLYSTGETYSFMENDSSEIFEIPSDSIDDILPYLKENLDVYLMIFEGNVIWVILPATIDYTISETAPWVRWDRATAAKKPAILDNWLEVMVAEHKSVWDNVTVNTTTWEAK